MGFRDTGEEKKIKRELEEHDWQLFLAYIGARKTGEPEFRELFDRLLQDTRHRFHKDAKTLDMLYDFTPIQPAGE